MVTSSGEGVKIVRLKYNLERRRERLWNKRHPDTLDGALELIIDAVELQERCLAK